MPHSSKDIRYVCTMCHRLIGPYGQPGEVSQDRGGNRVKYQICKPCGEKAGL